MLSGYYRTAALARSALLAFHFCKKSPLWAFCVAAPAASGGGAYAYRQDCGCV